MTVLYAATVERLGWLIDSVEKRLGESVDGTPVDEERLHSACPGRRATVDETTAVLEALADLGLLSGFSGRRTVNRAGFENSAQYRAGVRAGLATPRARAAGIRLCAALPMGIPTGIEDVVRRSTEDLRGAVVDLAAEAREDLTLASPFWDAATLLELGPILVLRLEAGVRLRLLGRFGRGLDKDSLEMLTSLDRYPLCELLSWYEAKAEDPLGTHSFHFKAAIADHGVRAYLGTANFTLSGLRSRVEFGVLLEGDAAARFALAVEAVLGLARPVILAGPTGRDEV